MGLRNLLKNLPEVKSPEEKKIGFNVKLKWTLVILIAYFVLSNIPIYGGTDSFLSQFENLAVVLGTSFGSIITLGISPIVTASIILQLLSGSGILNVNLSTPEGKKYFSGLQKLLAFALVIFTAVVYVLVGGVQAVPGFQIIVILQLVIGGFLIIFMDEVVQKWGFGSGISLFIAAGVSWRLFTALFQFINTQGVIAPVGKILEFIASLIAGNGVGATWALYSIGVTALIFLGVVWAQSLKVEIPLSFDRVRGHGVRWPLKFFYAGVIPVIFVSIIATNLQMFGAMMFENLGWTFLGTFANGVPTGGFVFWIHSVPLLELIIKGSFNFTILLQGIFHILFYVVLSVVFAFFWINTSGYDARSKAKEIINSGLSMPGFRKDERVLESILKRYITPLTIMGGAAIGLLASFANLFGALVGGTAILLVVMILYQFYENIAQQHAVDMNPSLKGFFGA